MDMSPPWLEVVMAGPRQAADAWADYIYSVSGQGVRIDDLPDPPGGRRVTGYIGVSAELPAQRAMLEACFASLKEQWPDDLLDLSFSDLENRDWSENWKKHFHPRRVTWRLIVAPPWEKAEPEPNQQVLIIDPGQAFGTGQHESTLLCLRYMERLRRNDEMPATMLDVGCGTGILALAALLMGAARATAIDVDPLAVAATEHNTALNNLGDRITASGTPLEDLTEDFGLIAANLTAKELVELASPLARRLSAGGRLITSGLLVEQIDPVRRAFEAQGLAMLESDSMAGWATLVVE